jgi:hypothetical protein
MIRPQNHKYFLYRVIFIKSHFLLTDLIAKSYSKVIVQNSNKINNSLLIIDTKETKILNWLIDQTLYFDEVHYHLFHGITFAERILHSVIANKSHLAIDNNQKI